MFLLAHLSDPHLPLPEARASALLSKRLTGYLSWQMKRHAIHVPQALSTVLDDIRAQAPDHIALTGDIANISLPAEFDLATRWLESFAPPDRLTLVPGNHDRYVSTDWSETLGQWAPYMQGDDSGPPHSDADYPFVRRRGETVLIGLSTAVPTLPFLARGKLGRDQIERLDATLAQFDRDTVCRIVLIHHPPHIDGASWRKGLADAEELRRVLHKRGAELILHGHNHRTEIGRIDGPDGAIPVVGVISASAAANSPYGRGGWNAIRIRREASAWRIDIEHRCLSDDAQSCRPLTSFALHSPAIAARAARQ